MFDDGCSVAAAAAVAVMPSLRPVALGRHLCGEIANVAYCAVATGRIVVDSITDRRSITNEEYTRQHR